MSSPYTHLNLLELDDVVAGRAEGVEGRFGRTAMEARDIGVSHWRYAPDFQSPVGHKHREQEEAYLVIGGSGRVLLDGDTVELRQWDLVRVAPEVTRAFAAGPDGLEIVAVGGPKPEGGDGEPGEVNWPG
jgi:quercetin dioxygenase-like cupin family protein